MNDSLPPRHLNLVHPDAHPPVEELPSAELDLVVDVLGPTGLRSAPGVTAGDLVEAATELVRRLLGVDDCWLQPPGTYADTLVRTTTAPPGPLAVGRPSTLRGPGGGRAGADVTRTAATAVVVVGGETHVLVAWPRRPRSWSRRDRAFLQATAQHLAAGLESVALLQSPAQQARRQFADFKRELLVTLNHELRTPLSVLGGVLELMEDSVPDEGCGHDAHLQRLQRNVARLMDLAENVNMLARGLPDPMLRDEAVTDPVEVAAAVVAELAVQGRAVEVAAAPGLVARIQRDDLRELLERVLGNAVKFTPPEARVWLTLAPSSEDDAVEIVVRDEGMGIPETEQHRLGEYFFRSSAAQQAERQGAGLGLAAAMAIAARWAGHLVIDSSPGSGTEVRIVVPAATRRQARAGTL